MFGIAILMTVVTTLLGPILLSASFENPAPGLRHPDDVAKSQSTTLLLSFPSPDMADFMTSRIVRAFRQEEFYVFRLTPEERTYHIRKDDIFFILECEGRDIRLSAPARYETLARLMVAEEMLTLRSMLHVAQENGALNAMEQNLVAGLFGGGTPDFAP